MINYISGGNLFESSCEAWTNTVNTVGIMGKGLALQFKDKFPSMFEDYQEACKYGQVQIAKMYVYNNYTIPKYIINFPTKAHWKNPSQLGWIIGGLKDLNKVAEKLQVQSIALPALGCTNGGLKWENVRKAIEAEHTGYISTIRVDVYEPRGQEDT